MRYSRVLLQVVLLAIVAVIHTASNVVLPVSKDAQVMLYSRACNPCSNAGSSSEVVIGNYQIQSEGLFGFDLTSIPVGSIITSATLQLPAGSSPFAPQTVPVSVYKLVDNGAWTESTVIWDNKPAFVSPAIGSVDFVAPGPATPLDVTAEVQSVLSSRSVGFRVTSNLNVFFNAKESGTGATLSVEYEAPSTDSCGGRCGSNNQCCNGQCFNPSTHTCTSNGVLCPSGYSSCGASCYLTSQYVCYDGFLCPAGMSKCGNSCYVPKQFSCCNNVLSAVGSC
jgi:hypothetical protein